MTPCSAFPLESLTYPKTSLVPPGMGGNVGAAVGKGDGVGNGGNEGVVVGVGVEVVCDLMLVWNFR